MNRSFYLLPTALAAALALGACSPRTESETAGQTVDRKMAEAKDAGRDAAQATREAGATAANAATDATITTKINAALAADDRLKATRIDVDTSNGRVTLTGSAPDAASKDRATTLARAVEGVADVENRLTVAAGG